MIWIFTLWAGIATYALGDKLLSTPDPTVAQYVVFGVAALFTLVGVVFCYLTGDDE